MTTIGVLLSGCGVKDGSEIHEAVLTLLFLDRKGAQVICMAPNIDQRRVINHHTGENTGETRNVLVESARIARGNIRDLADVSAGELDGLIIPGGFGAVCNLSDFSEKGKDLQVDPGVKNLLRKLHELNKPIGALCIAPATLAGAIADKHPAVTIGNDLSTAGALQEIGAVHHDRTVGEICLDAENNLVTTPAYMLGPGIKDIAVGIEKLVDTVLERAGA